MNVDPHWPFVLDLSEPRVLYSVALTKLAAENPRRWGKHAELYRNRPDWWVDKYIDHNKRMAEQGLPQAIELVTTATALRLKA